MYGFIKPASTPPDPGRPTAGTDAAAAQPRLPPRLASRLPPPRAPRARSRVSLLTETATTRRWPGWAVDRFCRVGRILVEASRAHHGRVPPRPLPPIVRSVPRPEAQMPPRRGQPELPAMPPRGRQMHLFGAGPLPLVRPLCLFSLPAGRPGAEPRRDPGHCAPRRFVPPPSGLARAVRRQLNRRPQVTLSSRPTLTSRARR